jgi:mismatch-specific thymine-DNA glycosylase
MAGEEQSLTFGESLRQFAYKKESEVAQLKSSQPEPIVVSPKKRELDQVNDDQSTPVGSPSKSRKVKDFSKTNGRTVSMFPETFIWKPLLKSNLKCVFIGFNPGTVSALTGHHYAHHSNLFWKLIYESGCVDRKVTHEDDVKLPDEYSYGFTDLVQRPTVGISDLSGSELLAGVPLLENRIRECAPKSICFIGKGIWESVHKVKKGRPLSKQFNWGLQPEGEFGVDHVFVFPSTSGLVGGIPRAKKLELWKELAEFLKTVKLEPEGKTEDS